MKQSQKTRQNPTWTAAWPIALALMLSCAGCGGSDSDSARYASAGNSASGSASSSSETQTRADAASGNAPSVPAALTSASGAQAQSQTAQKAALQRKIIYTAEVSLVADNLTNAENKLRALVTQNKGYLSDANVSGSSGAPRTGRFKARVPVDRYDAFMNAVTRLGEVQTINATSQDVSAEYFDIGARLSNKKREEARLLQLLANRTARLQDVLIVEREISRVREEIERMQGRLNVLASLSALTTVTVTINEIKNYVPPKPPTFATEIARTFSGSIGALSEFGKGVLLMLVALAPWLLVGAVFAWPAWKLGRRFVWPILVPPRPTYNAPNYAPPSNPQASNPPPPNPQPPQQGPRPPGQP